jgi:hypothetical protein
MRVVVDGVEGPPYDKLLPTGPAFRDGGAIEYLAVKASTLYRVKQW